jgi:F-type H+-transporting ATPase subunit b
MPQLSQLSQVYLSQFLWLAIALGFIFFVIAKGMVPKIQATVDAREQRIADDLEAAQKARTAADETEADWRARMDAARADAARIAQEAKQASARDTESKVKAAVDKLTGKLEKAEARIREAREAARSEIEAVASEAARDMVSRLTGKAVDPKQAAVAVRDELHVCGADHRRHPGARAARGGADRVLPQPGRLGRIRSADRLRAADLEESPWGRGTGTRQQDRADPQSARRSGIAAQGSRGAEGRI